MELSRLVIGHHAMNNVSENKPCNASRDPVSVTESSNGDRIYLKEGGDASSMHTLLC